MKITKTTKIESDDGIYLLEEGDEISVNEGLISRALLAVINKFIPLDIFERLDPQTKIMFGNILKDPEKSKMFKKIYREEPEFLKMFM